MSSGMSAAPRPAVPVERKRRWRGWIPVAIAALSLGGCYGALMIGEPHTRLGTESIGLMHAMWALHPELRPSIVTMEEKKAYKDTPIKPVEGTVPFGVGHIWVKPSDGGLHCDRVQDPHCFPLIVGAEVYGHQGLLKRIESTIRDLCSAIPVPTQPYSGESFSRRNDTRRLREWAGCDGAARERRTIVLYVVRDVDGLVALGAADRRRMPASSWPQHVVEMRTLFINE
ncbi:MAG: hypothetical protein HY778_02890 [Betaproteobacteria bacterium]|nr:hypothetical protein [Betaproteobacteria bacterium]